MIFEGVYVTDRKTISVIHNSPLGRLLPFCFVIGAESVEGGVRQETNDLAVLVNPIRECRDMCADKVARVRTNPLKLRITARITENPNLIDNGDGAIGQAVV